MVEEHQTVDPEFDSVDRRDRYHGKFRNGSTVVNSLEGVRSP
jgi:hypothetical protein